jgi:hypothetical protein
MKNEDILRLLQKHIDTQIETVAVQGISSLDFRNVFIGSLVTLVKKTYEAGRDAGYGEGIEAGQEMNAFYAKECDCDE